MFYLFRSINIKSNNFTGTIPLTIGWVGDALMLHIRFPLLPMWPSLEVLARLLKNFLLKLYPL